MKFKDFDTQMRQYEKSLDQFVPEDEYIVARLDGRSFSKLTKKDGNFMIPNDEYFNALMVETTKALMNTGFKITYAYTQSDEISLLFNRNEQSFNRNVRKLITTLAGEASATFSLSLGRTREASAFQGRDESASFQTMWFFLRATGRPIRCA